MAEADAGKRNTRTADAAGVEPDGFGKDSAYFGYYSQLSHQAQMLQVRLSLIVSPLG